MAEKAFYKWQPVTDSNGNEYVCDQWKKQTLQSLFQNLIITDNALQVCWWQHLVMDVDYVKNLKQTKTDGENKLVSQPFSQPDHHRQCPPLLQLPRQWVQQGLEQVFFIIVIWKKLYNQYLFVPYLQKMTLYNLFSAEGGNNKPTTSKPDGPTVK